jgi:hypothetical protein
VHSDEPKITKYDEFGGWPEDLSEFPINFMTEDHKISLARKCSNNPEMIEMPAFLALAVEETPTTLNKECRGDKDGQDEADEEWELKKIMSIQAVNHEAPIKCTDCDLCAAVLYIDAKNPTVKWYACLDCQVR